MFLPRSLWAAVLAIGITTVRPGLAAAENVHVAVAANFSATATEIARQFEKATGHKAILSFGSTGQLYTQIAQDAPFEVFLAADQERPRKAVDEGLAEAASRFTYATGKIALYSAVPGVIAGESSLRDGAFGKIAIANPVTSPYGVAAVETMKALGLYDRLGGKIVQGNNISQTFQFVATGNAELGFIALSQIARAEGGSRWVVPVSLYSPIRQDAVLLNKGAKKKAARAFLSFLKSPAAVAVIEAYGYGVTP